MTKSTHECPDERTTRPPRSRAARIWHDLGKPVLIVFVALFSFRSAIADWNDVPTGSMKPTILEGDRILVNKIAYDLKVPFTRLRVARWGEPSRGEVVVLFAPDSGTRLVKRVIGLPGDVIELRRDVLYLNGVPATYGPPGQDDTTDVSLADRDILVFASERFGSTAGPVGVDEHGVAFIRPGVPLSTSPRSFGPVTVPPDHFFVMGDNRNMSADSRAFGFVHRDLIMGRSSRIALSVDRTAHYKPRWSRFLKPLD